MAYRAFVSSTFVDLKAHRKRVIDTLRRSGFAVDPMEAWGASAKAPSAFSRERIVGCDLFILLVARRRGHVPRGRKRSITQLEHEAAINLGIDVLPYVLADEVPWPAAYDELASDRELRRWLAEIFETHGVRRFGPSAASLDIAPDLVRWIAERQSSELARGKRPESMPWNPKAVRLGRLWGLLTVREGKVDFSPAVTETLHATGDDWIRGKPLLGSARVSANWTEYSTMALVLATSKDAVIPIEDQDLLYIECQHQLIQRLLDVGLAAGVLSERAGALSVADDLNDEMLELFAEPTRLEPYLTPTGDPRDAAMLAFADMVRVRLATIVPADEPYAEALGTIVLSTFGFWQGPANAGKAVGAPSGGSRTRTRRKTGR